MRSQVSEGSIEHYCDPTDLVDHFTPGEGQLEKRRSALYKCRSVEDFASSSSHEVSQWNEFSLTLHIRDKLSHVLVSVSKEYELAHSCEHNHSNQ